MDYKLTISIYEETESLADMADVLRRVADLLEDGFSAGVDPAWNVKFEEVK